MSTLDFLARAMNWLANYYDLLAFIFVVLLGLRAVIFDRRAFRRRDYSKEVAVTLNSLRPRSERGGPKWLLCIRNVYETTMIDAMGQSNHAVKLLTEAARRTIVGHPVLRFQDRFATEEIVHEIINELSRLTGVGFLRNETTGRFVEDEYVFALTCEKEDSCRRAPINVRVQLIRKTTLEQLIANEIHLDDDRCQLAWELEQPQNPRYQQRNLTLREVLKAYVAWKKGAAGSELLAIGELKLVPSDQLAAA